MKVHEAVKPDLVQKQAEVKRSTREDVGFNHVLEQELSRVDDPTTTGQGGVESLALSSISQGPLLDALGNIPALTNGMGAEVQNVTDRLSTVEQTLLSGSASRQQLGDAIGALSSEAERLGDITKNLPVNHPLKQIAGELSILAHVETMKLKRGDYA
jgi:hypothetical protein